MKRHLLFTVFMTIFISCITAQHKRFDDFFDSSHFKPVKLSSATLSPQRIVWVSTTDKNTISAPDNLLKPFDGQLATNTTDFCTFFKQEDTDTAAVILDFGREIYGNIRIFAPIRSDKKTVRIRVRLGESVSETMSETGGTTADSSATNDHSLRDYILEIPWLGSIETGQSGFRFVRIDLLDKGVKLPLKTVQAICRYRDIPYLGSFHCNDERLNRIWETGAYTVHLNMQEYLWDGIKRDRLVWLGDMHPEVMTITSVFGNNEVITKSLDFARDNTPLPGWMNDMCAYSLWWLIIHRDLYLYSGNYEYLKKQHTYISGLLRQIISHIHNGKEALPTGRFLDWPTARNPNVIHSGLQSLSLISMRAGEQLAIWLEDKKLQKECSDCALNLEKNIPELHDNKQAAALSVLAGYGNVEETALAVIARDGAERFATFYGYYMLEALAAGNCYEQALKIISDYWGAMLDLGATTFWEDLDYSDALKAARIDEVIPAGKYDIHAKGGDHCYKGFRHSFCHGWASGPTAWMSRYVLGAIPIEPGCKTVRISPHLGNLDWVEGTVPTPLGIIKISHKKSSSGKITSRVEAPEGIRVILKK